MSNKQKLWGDNAIKLFHVFEFLSFGGFSSKKVVEICFASINLILPYTTEQTRMVKASFTIALRAVLQLGLLIRLKVVYLKQVYNFMLIKNLQKY
jgi:hypothetical protein